MNQSTVWPCSIAVDVGGTFTDLVMIDDAAVVRVVKVPSVPRDPSRGAVDAVHRLADDLGVDTRTLLENCSRFVHGSTVATNAVLEDNLARVGLLTTSGFRDALEIRRGIRVDQWDHRQPWPAVPVPRYLRIGVGGRIDRDGNQLEALREDDVHRAMDTFAAEEVETVAICFLHSYRNAAHEHRAGELMRSRWPGDLTTVSCELVPLLGEYERTSTTVINAGLVPMVGGYLRRLEADLCQLGLSTSLLLLQSNGGTVPVDAVASRPINLVLSGPAAVGGALGRLHDADRAQIVSMDIGGTSCDVAVLVDGEVPVIDGLEVGGRHLNVPAVDVHSIGAGGGTIASVDSAGLLEVGPRGAGADPGPACYRRGGVEPTATDAHLLLGRLRPGPYAGGAITLDPDLASEAMHTRVAEPLGLDLEQAAVGVVALLEQHLRQAVETITIERGRDPARMTLVAAGGAGGLHGSAVARALGCRRVVIPADAGVFCAVGMLHSPLRRDTARTVVGSLDDLGLAGLAEALASENERLDGLLFREWPSDASAHRSTHVDLRYPGQLWSIRIDVAEGFDETSIRLNFEREYERLFGHIQPEGRLDVTGVGVVATAHTPDMPTSATAMGDHPSPVAIAERRCWVNPEDSWLDVPVYSGDDLHPGQQLDGPFLIESTTTTVLGCSGDQLEVLANGDVQLELR